jgi:hypothetical protein
VYTRPPHILFTSASLLISHNFWPTQTRCFTNTTTTLNNCQNPSRTQTEQIAEVIRSCITDKINDFIDIFDVLPHHQAIARNKCFLNLVALGMSTAAFTLSTYNSACISTFESQIILDHLVDVSNCQAQHFKAIDQKLDDVSDKLATMLHINKVYFAKMTDFMEQKFGTAVDISECLIHMAYKNRLVPGALHYEVLLEIIRYVNEIANNS